MAEQVRVNALLYSRRKSKFFQRLEALESYARQNYAPLALREADAVGKMEWMRLEYKKIIRRLSASQLRDLFDRFTVNFTYESNALEGNSLSLRQVAIVIYENAAIRGKSLMEVYDARNSREVVDLILNNKFRVREKDAIRMHSMLVRDTGVAEGYKKLPNYLVGRQVITTLPEKVSREMKTLFAWYKKNRGAMHPLQLAARFHGAFEAIHPFEDGNGRTGRFLINAALVNAGYPPLIIRKTQRISYFNALADFDNDRPNPLEEFLYARLKETHEKFFKSYANYI